MLVFILILIGALVVLLYQNRLFTSLMISVFAIFAGIRENLLGFDYSFYKQYYLTIEQHTFDKQLYEIGYYYLNKFWHTLAYNFGIPYEFYLLILLISCIYHYGLYKLIYVSKQPYIYLILIIGQLYLWQAYIITRQSIAIAILCIAFAYTKSYKDFQKFDTNQAITWQYWLIFLLVIILASSFHLSAIVLLAVPACYIICNFSTLIQATKNYLKVKPKIYTLVTVFSVSMLVCLIVLGIIYNMPMFLERVNRHNAGAAQVKASSMPLIEALSIAGAYYFLSYQHNKNNTVKFIHNHLINASLLSNILYSSLGLLISEIFLRFNEYFKLIALYVTIEIVCLASKHYNLKVWQTNAIFGLLILYSLFRYIRFLSLLEPSYLKEYAAFFVLF